MERLHYICIIAVFLLWRGNSGGKRQEPGATGDFQRHHGMTAQKSDNKPRYDLLITCASFND